MKIQNNNNNNKNRNCKIPMCRLPMQNMFQFVLFRGNGHANKTRFASRRHLFRLQLKKCEPNLYNLNSLWIISLIMIAFGHINYCIGTTNVSDENGPLSDVESAVGLDTTLPCDLLPTVPTIVVDKVQLIIWYKDGNVKPIYTFDARGRSLREAIHWADEDVFKSKAHFTHDSVPTGLRIKNVRREDAGVYRCRVDFQKSPTKNSRINLTVLVPPAQLSVLDENGANVVNNVVGPYPEGASLNMTCISSGGIPPPKITWWKEHALLDDSYEVLPDGSVKNVLYLDRTNRKDLNTIYTCQASNGHILPPLSSVVKLDLKLTPLYVQINGLNHGLTSGMRTHFSCSSAGARPPPELLWSRGGVKMRGATQSTSNDGNITISDLVYLPVPEDNGKIITCSVLINTVVDRPSLYLKDARTLDIKHAPIITLSLGAPLNPKQLIKGSDVYLECDIKANPAVKRIDWFHNNEPLLASRGIIITNQTLVLQSISKATHGQYLCRAGNAQGTVNSNEIFLDIKYPPICKADAQIVRAALRQTINITCDIDSNPMINLTYKWSFNNSLDSTIELPAHTNDERIGTDDGRPRVGGGGFDDGATQAGGNINVVYANINHLHHFNDKDLKKMQQYKDGRWHEEEHGRAISTGQVYRYRLESFTDYGTVTCNAENDFGQSGPCLYHILAADPPDPVKNCSAYNATAYSMQIACVPGKDGGIRQQFGVLIMEEITKNLLYNVSFKSAEFTLKRLPSDTKFIIKITPYNLQGYASQSYRLRVKTLSAPLLRTASSRAVLVQLTPLLGAIVGMIVTLILVAVCLIIFVKFKKKTVNSKYDATTNEPEKSSSIPLSANVDSHSSIDDKNPDVIPHETSDDEYMSEEKQFDRLNIDRHRNLFATSLNFNNYSPTVLSSTTRLSKQYADISLTTNPAFLYSTPIKGHISPTPSASPSVMRSRSPPNIYTRLPTKPYSPITTNNYSAQSLGSTSTSSTATTTYGGSGGSGSCPTMPLLKISANYGHATSPNTLLIDEKS